MDNNFNNNNVQPNQVPNPEQGRDYASQYAKYNEPRTGFENAQQPQQPAQNPYQQPDYNQYQPQQPDYNQQPVQPDYNQYQPQQPDYNQQPVQPDYNQYQPQQPDYNQYQPQQPDYNQYPQQSVQPYDYNQAGYQQPDYSTPYQGNVYNPQGEVLSGAPKVFSIISLICGIISMVICCYGFIPGIAGLVFSLVAKAKFKGKNTMATLGLIFSIVGLAISVISLIVMIVLGINEGSSSYRYY